MVLRACRTSAATMAKTLYGTIPQEQWSYPSWITPEDAAAARKSMVQHGVLYGGRESYHHMCRYFSGFFYRHPLLLQFDYYWRMEPDVHYYCDLDYDPFLFMEVSTLPVRGHMVQHSCYAPHASRAFYFMAPYSFYR